MTQPNDPLSAISAELLDRCGEVNYSPFGLTKREYFAAMAMQGYIASLSSQSNISSNDQICGYCVGMADSLIEALNNETKTEPNA